MSQGRLQFWEVAAEFYCRGMDAGLTLVTFRSYLPQADQGTSMIEVSSCVICDGPITGRAIHRQTNMEQSAVLSGSCPLRYLRIHVLQPEAR
jgi:hypothetical protein